MKTCFATVSDVSCGLNVFYFSSFILVLGVELLKVVIMLLLFFLENKEVGIMK